MTYLAAGLFCVVWGVIIASTGQPLIFIDAVSLLAVSAGAACFALAAEEGQRLVRFGQGGLADRMGGLFCRACAYSKQLSPC